MKKLEMGDDSVNLDDFLDEQEETVTLMACENCESVDFMLCNNGSVRCSYCESTIGPVMWVHKQ